MGNESCLGFEAITEDELGMCMFWGGIGTKGQKLVVREKRGLRQEVIESGYAWPREIRLAVGY